MFLIFDTETTGRPHNYNAPLTDSDNWPRLVQIAWQLHSQQGKLLAAHNYIIRPDGFDIPFMAEKIHGISTQRALDEGHELRKVIDIFLKDLTKAVWLVGHNVKFDINIVGAELIRLGLTADDLINKKQQDTGDLAIEFCQLPGGIGGKLKIPKLNELYEKLFNNTFPDAHDAAYDVEATAHSYFELLKRKIIPCPEDVKLEELNYETPELSAGNSSKRDQLKFRHDAGTAQQEIKIDASFCHLHVHSMYSVLQATPDVKSLIKKAKELQMPAIALTDFGNMYGVFKFVKEAHNNDIKPIVGCEFFLAEERTKLKFTKDNPDKRYNQVLLAKNKAGYQNLIQLTSTGFTEGLYGIHPRIDKALVEQYHENLICLTGSLNSEIPYLILHIGEKQAEEAFQWWHKLFKDDFYVELNRHGSAEEEHVNKVLIRLAKKYKVKIIAANEVFYIEKADANAHDVLLCIKEGEFKSTPIGEGRGFRYGLNNEEYYLKSQEEMKALFADIPEAIINIAEIVDKVEAFELDQKVLLPAYSVPAGFDSQDEYLKHITYEGAKERYGEITPEIRERLDFELETIKKTGYPGYFLIVQDFTRKAREMHASVGPGRGSAAGSAVAYCTGITNIDPIKYNLLFERFLNPDRVSLPDIDIDFDDEGRDKVLQYVISKYGKNQVAQIITYGTMAARSAIRDCARVMELPLSEANALAKLVPERPGMSLQKAFEEVQELDDIRKGTDLRAQVLQQAIIIEGSLRNTGTHACGVIITPDELTRFVPVATAKDSDMLVTQFDNSVVENAGLLKMDFLGLTNLSIIKTCLKNIKKRHGIDIDIDAIPLDDTKTYELFQRGETGGIFQFESPGMQKHLKALKPDKFEDLIAMNALYRPGPIVYIPNFINRKHGKEAISYDLPEMAEYLEETYGITVYQEQVMLLSQKLAGFSKGDADVLRKAMGKKQKEVLDKMKSKFIDGCKQHNHPVEICEKIWTDWEAFAQYAFNKSHSTCYSLVAYQTAYLKANYPAEYMAAVLTHNQGNIDNVTFFIEECKSIGLTVLGPHLNESAIHFAVNDKGEIRFGLGAIKGAGEAAVEAIIQERDQNGAFKDIFEFAKRVNLRAVNKKTFECLALSGAFDCFKEYHRRQYVYAADGDLNLIEKATRYAIKLEAEEQSAQVSLFGGGNVASIPKPSVPFVEPFGEIEKLNLEKDVIGIYISGHPLDNFKFEIDWFCNCSLSELNNIENLEGRELKLGGIVTHFEHRTTKTGKPFGTLTIEDYSGNYRFALFGEDYFKFKEYLMQGLFLFVEAVVIRQSWGNQQLEPKIKSIDLLNELGSKKSKGIQLSLNFEDLDEGVLSAIENI
ncbi:MAG TPA: DNA polymerase III subunit alpha, partial [Cyclobacteriaceae bacterium]|nr:DNA polymerase III subunit alpha [Cyclobacteriaceae bacterium]